MKRKTGFTLTELLVVLGIILLLAAIMLPVFISAKAAAAQTVCMSNLKQASSAMVLYHFDYDDRYTPVNYEPGQKPDPENDRTWVQLLLPYARSIDIFRDPGDTGVRPRDESTFDEDLFPDDTYEKYYQQSLRSDIGFNYIYLSPIFEVNGQWRSEPKESMSVADQSKTIMFVDSVWARDENGVPFGGGNWLVVPPCRMAYQPGGAMIDTFSASPSDRIFAVSDGWSGDSTSPVIYGQAWPWHNGHMNVAKVDTHVKSLTPSQLTLGCNLQPQWQGIISSPSDYPWSAGS